MQFILRVFALLANYFSQFTDCEGLRFCYVIGTWRALIGCIRTIEETESLDEGTPLTFLLRFSRNETVLFWLYRQNIL